MGRDELLVEKEGEGEACFHIALPESFRSDINDFTARTFIGVHIVTDEEQVLGISSDEFFPNLKLLGVVVVHTGGHGEPKDIRIQRTTSNKSLIGQDFTIKSI